MVLILACFNINIITEQQQQQQKTLFILMKLAPTLHSELSPKYMFFFFYYQHLIIVVGSHSGA